MQSDLVVLTPAGSQDLISLYTVRSELDITTDTDDVKLGRWISDASERIANHCGRPFRLETVQETFWADSFGIRPCLLSRRPIISIASVSESGTALSADDYRLRGNRLWRLSSDDPIAWSRVGEVVVTYTAGYAQLTDVPAVLQRACLTLVSDYYFSSQRSPTVRRESVSIEGVETVSQDYVTADTSAAASALPANVEAILANYRDIYL